MPIKLPTPPPVDPVVDLDTAKKAIEKLIKYNEELVKELEKKVTA